MRTSTAFTRLCKAHNINLDHPDMAPRRLMSSLCRNSHKGVQWRRWSLPEGCGAEEDGEAQDAYGTSPENPESVRALSPGRAA